MQIVGKDFLLMFSLVFLYQRSPAYIVEVGQKTHIV